MAVIPNSQSDDIFGPIPYHYQEVDLFQKLKGHYSFLKISNETGCPMTFQFVYFDEDSCDFVTDYPGLDLFPDRGVPTESGFSAIYGVTGNRRASGLMGFLLQTGPQEWVAMEIYFLNPYNGSDQVWINLYVNNGGSIPNDPEYAKHRFKQCYDQAGNRDIKAFGPVSAGPISAYANLHTEMHSAFDIRLSRSS